MHYFTLFLPWFSIDYLQVKINSIITDKQQNGIAKEINFELSISTKKFKSCYWMFIEIWLGDFLYLQV